MTRPRLLPQLFPEAEILYRDVNMGFGAAVNLALRSALATDAEYVLLLNPDTTLAPDFLDRLVEAANERTLAGAKVLLASSGLLSTHAGRFSWYRGHSVDTHEGEAADSAFMRACEVDAAGFVCMLIPVGAFRAIGDFDERFGMYVEDTDFCIRARKAGFRVVIQPEAVVHHLGRASSGDSQNEFFQYYAARNRAYLLWKNGGLLGRFIYSASYVLFAVSDLVRFALRRDWQVVRARLLALRDAYRGRMGMTYQPHDFGRRHFDSDA